MIDFGTWFAKQAPLPDPEPELPDGFDERADGSLWVNCCQCGAPVCITGLISREEALGQDPTDQYCWGSPRCCP